MKNKKRIKKLWKYVKGLRSDLNWLMDTVAEMECHEHFESSGIYDAEKEAASPSILKSMVEEVRAMSETLDNTKKVIPMGKYGPIVEDERIAADPLVQEAAVQAMALGNLVEELCEECSEDPLAFTKRIEALREREEAEGYDQLTAALAERDSNGIEEAEGGKVFTPCSCDLCKRMREIEANFTPVPASLLDEAAAANDQLERALAERDELDEEVPSQYIEDVSLEIWPGPEHKI